eukprot:1158012-Pelagomonas_calceolata.AAC.2
MPDVERGGKSVEFSPRLVHGASDPGEAWRSQTSNSSNAGRRRPCRREGGFTMKRLSLVFSQPSELLQAACTRRAHLKHVVRGSMVIHGLYSCFNVDNSTGHQLEARLPVWKGSTCAKLQGGCGGSDLWTSATA